MKRYYCRHLRCWWRMLPLPHTNSINAYCALLHLCRSMLHHTLPRAKYIRQSPQSEARGHTLHQWTTTTIVEHGGKTRTETGALALKSAFATTGAPRIFAGRIKRRWRLHLVRSRRSTELPSCAWQVEPAPRTRGPIAWHDPGKKSSALEAEVSMWHRGRSATNSRWPCPRQPPRSRMTGQSSAASKTRSSGCSQSTPKCTSNRHTSVQAPPRTHGQPFQFQ